MNKEYLINLNARIIEEFYPDQKEVFNFYSEDLFDRYLKGENIEEPKAVSAEFEAGTTIDIVLDCLKIFAATLTTVSSYINLKKAQKLKRDISRKELESIWQRELLDKGIDANVATEIASKFAKDISSKLK